MEWRTLPQAPEVQAEDPHPTVPRGVGRVLAVLRLLLAFAVLAPVGVGLWPLYLLLRVFLPRPPLLPRPRRLAWLAGRILTERAPPPGRDLVDRGRLLVHLALAVALAPGGGIAWMLDELLYGRELAANPLERPLFEISGWRSGSTRLAHLLHDDPGLVAPTVLQEMVPYLWVWRLARRIFGGRLDRDAVTRRLASMFPPELAERHEVDAFRTDTFEIFFYRPQLVQMSLALGPATTSADFSHRGITPTTKDLWEDDFVRFVDGIGRRALAFAGPGPTGPRRFFLKGHFLAAAPALARRYPDAAFVTVVRDPTARLRSTLNYLRLNPDFYAFGPIPWPWIAATVPAEIAYNRNELAWFTRDDGVRRCVIRFDEFVADLPGAVGRIYREALGADGPPPEVRLTHERGRTGAKYTVDHPLEALGVDVPAFEAALADYRAWCRWERPAAPSRASSDARYSGVVST